MKLFAMLVPLALLASPAEARKHHVHCSHGQIYRVSLGTCASRASLTTARKNVRQTVGATVSVRRHGRHHERVEHMPPLQYVRVVEPPVEEPADIPAPQCQPEAPTVDLERPVAGISWDWTKRSAMKAARTIWWLW